jgi:Protein of unknown function (DUF2490)
VNQRDSLYGILFWFIFIPFGLDAQNVNQVGFLPVVSHTFVAPKVDVNILGASKISANHQRVQGVLYPASILEIYFQVQASLKLKPNLIVSGSYGFQRNNPFRENHTNEHRLGQQLIWIIRIKESHLYQRFRFEERFILNDNQPHYQFGTRGRYQVGFNHNVGSSNYFINLSNETFAILSGPRNAILSENISYVGIGKKAKIGNIEIGLVYNTIVRNEDYDLRNLVLFQVMWSSSMSRMKEKRENITLHMRHF